MKKVLNLGSGNDYIKSTSEIEYVNVDVNHDVKCDTVVNLEEDVFPWEDNSISGIVAKMIVEHIWKRDRFMNECWRVLKSGGKMYITTPMAGTVAYWKDPTHVSGWIPETFNYYCHWNTDPANRRKTWKLVDCKRQLIGDENEFIECVLQKP
jgi:predicted SAM-dependent methyltransferase